MTTLNSYIADGFMQDCEDLIHTLTNRYKKVDWHKFCYHWKDNHFDTIFYGRQSGAEVVEFTEEALQCARLYFVTETDNYEEQVVGLFIAYALLTIQPYKKLSALRLIPEDVEPITKFKSIAIEDGRNDVLMILGRVLIYGPTQFHVCVRERAMDLYLRKYFDGSTNVPFCILRRWHGIIGRERLKSFTQIDSLESKYADLKEQAKRTCQSVFPGKSIDVNMAQNVAKEITESLHSLITGVPMESKAKEVITSASLVKRKAMKKIVNPMSHLHGLDERKKGVQAHVVPLTPAKKPISKPDKEVRMSSPQPLEETETRRPHEGFSLPGIDELCNNNESPQDETLFKGLSNTAIETSEEDIYTRVKAVKSQFDEKKRKRKRSIEEEISADEAMPDNEILDKEPNGKWKKKKIKATDFVPAKKKTRRPIKNKQNRKIRLFEFTSEESNTSEESVECEVVDVPRIKTPTPPPQPPPPPPPKVYRGRKALANRLSKTHADGQTRELTLQSKGQVQHYIDVQVKDMPVVIRTEKQSRPIEIEIIDHYKGNNHLYEEVCEVSDDEENKNASDERIEPAKSVDLTTDDNTERCSFEIISYDDGTPTEAAGNQKDIFDINDAMNMADKQKIIDETVLSNESGMLLERRRLKQRRLKSKLKKMGILPVANFDDDSP